jgi:hypothetical protein
MLRPAQAKGLALLRDADDAVLDPVVAMPPIMWAAFEGGFRTFMHDPTDIDSVLRRLEEGREKALKEGSFLE